MIIIIVIIIITIIIVVVVVVVVVAVHFVCLLLSMSMFNASILGQLFPFFFLLDSIELRLLSILD